MPTETIPYDPSLVLGMVIQPDKIKQLMDIAEAQNPVNLAREKVNALLRQKLSLDMLIQELLSLDVDPKQIDKVSQEVAVLNEALGNAAIELTEGVINAEALISKLKTEQGQKQISSAVQSPVDFSASQLKPMPISSDSLSMDVQYFRYQENVDSNEQHSSKVAAFVGASVKSKFGNTGASVKVGSQVNESMTSAHSNHQLLGTVVFVVNCTHKTAQIFSPLILDVEAAIDSWIASKGDWDGDPEDAENMAKIAKTKASQEDYLKGLPILAGASYGSSFVGFVHFTQTETTQDSQETASAAAQVSAQITRDLWFAEASGEVGVSAEAARSARDLMSTSNIQSHCSVISMGIIPSIKSNIVKSTVLALKDDPKERMETLGALQGATNKGIQTMGSAAGNAKKKATMEEMETSYVSAAIQGSAEVDSKDNKVIDLNSMMTALDDFVARANNAEGGVPINFYIKYVSARSIAIAWLQQYYPDKLQEIRGVGTKKEDG